MTLTLNQVKTNLKKVDFTTLPKPKKTNKGKRGQLLELALGIANSSKLTDCVDGELKSFTQGESIAVTQLKHVLPEIMNHISFNDSKVGKKLKRTLYVGFDRKNNYIDSIELNETTDKTHYKELEEDFNFICEKIRKCEELSTTTGLNGLLQIRTKDSKNKKGNYHPVFWEGKQLSDKGYAFYLCGKFGRELL